MKQTPAIIALVAIFVLHAHGQKCYQSTSKLNFKIYESGCGVDITPKECLPEGTAEADMQATYDLSWKGTVLHANDAECKAAAELLCGTDKAKTGYQTCSSDFCDSYKKFLDASKHARECGNDDDCNVDGTLKVAKEICLEYGKDLLEQMCDLTAEEITTQLGTLQTLFGDTPNADDCAKPFAVCFDRATTTACRRLIDTSSPQEAYNACFSTSTTTSAVTSTPVAAERVLMRHLHANDFVLSTNDNGSLVFDRIVMNQHIFHSHLQSTLLTIDHDKGQLSVTPDHILPIDGELQAARNIRIGSHLVTPLDGVVTVSRIASKVSGIINPVTTSGVIVAADIQGSPVVSSTFGEWMLPLMAAKPLPYSIINMLASLFPETGQAFHDLVLEPVVVSASIPSVIGGIPPVIAPLCWLVFDVLMSGSLACFIAASTLSAVFGQGGVVAIAVVAVSAGLVAGTNRVGANKA
eukprot:CAMPEP_0196733494 /NCGR_PEP_ID=MMETSP1091-20130531/12520_1 /TAXON_ID=302021 /ORGANISM="Rhodomonas sp., Strain CCMP768" /LENGTH=465 /DNA_ID=CAMNT_0042076869 /DNA_START=26 /DNA_END=1423 /DNA_ORIENTATION=+